MTRTVLTLVVWGGLSAHADGNDPPAIDRFGDLPAGAVARLARPTGSSSPHNIGDGPLAAFPGRTTLRHRLLQPRLRLGREDAASGIASSSATSIPVGSPSRRTANPSWPRSGGRDTSTPWTWQRTGSPGGTSRGCRYGGRPGSRRTAGG